jgi:signal transduction histidine kinase
MLTSAVPSQSKETMTGVAAPEKVKLLLVDDDRDNLLALQAVLDPLKEELMLAGSGLEALRLCLDNDFAAILLDVRMPEMDGFETAEMIRARKRSRQTPILFLTAYRSDEQLFRGYDLGAVDFLFKPIVPEILQSKVSVFVELSRSEQLLRGQAETLARTQQKFRAVLEAAPDAMVITAEDGIIQLANSRTDSLFGYPREQLIGLNIRCLIPQWECPRFPLDGESGEQDMDPSQAAAANDGAYLDSIGRAPAETRLSAVCQNGSSFPAEITTSPFATDEGLLVTTAIRDATEQVRSEERIRRINIELEKRVAERTLDLTRSNEALRQFAWAASHDLQEPIRMVLSYTQWIAKTATARLDAGEAEMLQFVQENATRMGTLLAALRQYIYISESGDQETARVDCNAVVRMALSNLQGAIEEAGACVECEPLPAIDSVEVLLLQLFQNLIGNALKYRSSEPPTIRISAALQDGAWVFSVRDNGIGIEPQYLEYIFGVFKRLHGKKYSGTGIGLAICKAAVDRLGGRIWAESQPGAGSVFCFALPKTRME